MLRFGMLQILCFRTYRLQSVMYNFISCQIFPYFSCPKSFANLYAYDYQQCGKFPAHEIYTLLNIGSWVGSFHCNIWFICGSHHPCNTNLMFVGRPCQIQTNPQWSTPPPLPPPPPLFFFLKYHYFHRLEGKNTFLIGFKRKPLFQSVFNTNHFFYRFLQKTLYSSLFTTKRFLYRF